MPRKVLLLHLTEPDGVAPSDTAGNLADLAPSLGSAAPASVETWTGRGRQFVAANLNALVAADLAGRDTLLMRDMTVQAIMSLTLVAGTQVLIARGLNDGTASERHSFGIELEQQAGFPGFVEARWFWQDTTGALKVQPAGVWQHPGDGKLFLFTATRRWVFSKVVVRYYVGPDLVAELETADGDIAGGTTGHTTLGARQDGGAWEHCLNGTIDELLVTDHEMSPAEVRHTWRRLAEYQPGGLDAFRGLVPRGLPWARDLGNAVGRHVKHAGEALGFAAAGAEELRAMFLPDAAPLGMIERWERLCGLVPRPTDSLEIRQARVVGFLSREEGFSLPAIRVAMQEVLDLPAASIEILESTNRYEDAFDALSDERWLDGGGGTWVLDAGELSGSFPDDSDLRWETVGLGPHIRTSIDRGDAITVHCHVKLSAHDFSSDGSGAGVFLHNFLTRDTLWFGVLRTAGVTQLGYRTVIHVVGAFVALETPAPATAWLRITPPSTVAGQWTLSYSTTGPGDGFTHTPVALGELAFDWVGFGFFGTNALAGTGSADFDDLLVFCPRGLNPFYWYVLRDPLLAGALDVGGAHALVQRLKPAHTYAAVTQARSLICDDDRDGLCDRGPLGPA